MREVFGIASFRSRQQVLKFEGALRRAGIHTSIITTPRDVSMGCGLSIRFELEDYPAVREICDTLQIPWTHWGYTGGFSLFEGDLKGTKLIDGVAEALKLNE